jgi:DNA replication protein DnaC
MDHPELTLAPDPAEDGAPEGQVRDLNPHMRPRSRTDYACPHGLCGGEGFILDEETNVAKPCPCRAQRIAHARSRRLRSEIPERYRDVAWDRNPVPEILETLRPTLASQLRGFCRRIDEKLDKGEGLWFMGTPGTGKTTLAMLVSIAAIRARRAVAVYTAPQLLNHLYAAAKSNDAGDYNDLLRRLEAVDLLHIDDLAAQPPNDWVQQSFYSVVNARYEEKKSIIFTADVESAAELGKFVGERTASRLLEMCGANPIPMFGKDRRLDEPGALYRSLT